jgi:hypothetical protein
MAEMTIHDMHRRMRERLFRDRRAPLGQFPDFARYPDAVSYSDTDQVIADGVREGWIVEQYIPALAEGLASMTVLCNRPASDDPQTYCEPGELDLLTRQYAEDMRTALGAAANNVR